MEPVLPDAPVEESGFDLDVRVQPVARDVSAGPTEHLVTEKEGCGTVGGPNAAAVHPRRPEPVDGGVPFVGGLPPDIDSLRAEPDFVGRSGL
jgi:hypothetical protein